MLCRSLYRLRWLLSPSAGLQVPANFLADLYRGRSHDIKVPRIFRQKISRAFDFDEQSYLLLAFAVRQILDQWFGAQAIARHILLDALDHRLDGAKNLCFFGLGQDAVHCVAHQDRWLGGIENDDRLAARSVADL